MAALSLLGDAIGMSVLMVNTVQRLDARGREDHRHRGRHPVDGFQL